MSPDGRVVPLKLLVDAGEDADPEELDRLTRQLLAEIRDLDIDAELARGAPLPEGTLSVDAVTIGALVLAVLPTVVPKLVDFLQAWSLREEGRKVKIKTQVGDRALEVEYSPTSMSPNELRDLVDALSNSLKHPDQLKQYFRSDAGGASSASGRCLRNGLRYLPRETLESKN